MTTFTKIYIIICVIWVVFERRLLKSKRSSKDGEDKGSLRLLWATIAVSAFLGNFLPYTSIARHAGWLEVLRWPGLAVILVGLAVRLVAIRTLGSYFTVNVATADGQELIDRGPYRTIRHPAYLGSLISFAGMGFALANWVSLMVIVVPVTTAFLFRIKVEEDAMVRHFGDRYLKYKKRTFRLIPFLY